MSGKTFHLRANEVRAEAQALMQKLRAERFAASRAGKRALRLKAEEAAAAPAPPPAPSAPSRIVVSRKIKAAVVAPAPPSVEVEAPPIELIAVQAAAPRKRRAKKVEAADPEAPPTVQIAPEAVAPVIESVIAEAPFVDMRATEPGQDEPTPRPAKKRNRKARAPKAELPVDAVEPLVDANPVATLQETIAVSMSAPAEKPVSGRAQMPISLVPSLGPGMIWRLNQLGLHTLHDLAESSPEELRGKLGPVARLVRVENWIDFARAA